MSKETMSEQSSKDAIRGAVETIITAVGDDSSRPGLQGTPERVAKAFCEWLRGYGPVPFQVTMFPTAYAGPVVRRGIPFQSFCEHHLACYHGTVDLAYLPKGQVMGLSKIIRLVQHWAARLTIQEDLTDDIANRFAEAAGTPDVAVIVTACHSCEKTRGVRVGDVPTVTRAMRGRYASEPELQREFYALLGKSDAEG